VLIEGRLEPDPVTGAPRIWEGKDGEKKASFEVTAEQVRFLSSRNDGDGMTEAAASLPGAQFVAAPEDDLPF
jgi:single-strand DNA-binding protein